MNFSIEMSKDGYRILMFKTTDGKKKYLGNKYSQGREIEKFIDEFNDITEGDNYIIFGLSLGEHIKSLLKKIGKKSHILIIEHNQSIIDFCKKDDQVQSIFNNPQVMLAVRDDEIEQFFRQYINEINIGNLKIAEYCSYYHIYEDYLYNKYEVVKKEITRITLNRNTIIKPNDIIFNNFLGNLKYLAKSTPINALKDKYSGVPAVIVSAGPSLSKNIDYLKCNGKRLVLSGGRTLRTLIDKQIIPHCVGSVDFTEVAYKLVEGYLNKYDIPLVVSDKTNYKILEEHNGNKFFFSENDIMNEVWNENIQDLFGGGSIAHSLTLMAVYMGCNPIIFIGQDFAYTDDREHDILAENKWEENMKSNEKSSCLYVEDINGEPVRTSVELNDYRLSLEKIISENPEITFINATEGGANIKGAVNRIFKDVVSEFEDDKVESLNKFSDNIDMSDNINEKLCQVNMNIKDCIKLCRNVVKESKDWKTNYRIRNSIKLKSCEEKIKSLDKEFNNKLRYMSIIKPLLIKVIYDVKNDKRFIINTSDRLDIKLNKNMDLICEMYLQMEDVLKDSYKKIENTINKIQ